MPTIKITNNYSLLLGDIPHQAYAAIDNECSYYLSGYVFSKKYNTISYTCRDCGSKKSDQSGLILCPSCKSNNLEERREWDGKSHLAKQRGKCITFPTGLFSKIRDILKEQNINSTIIDERNSVVLSNSYTLNDKYKLRDYQEFSVNKSCECQRGIIQVGTGGGKNIISVGIMSKTGLIPTIFYVLSKDLLLQAKEEFEDKIRKNGQKINIGMVGAGECDIQDITVMTIQTAVRAFGKRFVASDDDEYEDDKTDIAIKKQEICDFVRSAKLVFVDECHHAPSDIVRDIMNESKDAKYRFGLSASPWRDDGNDMLIEAQFGRKIVKITSSYLIKNNYLVKPKIYFKRIKSISKKFHTYKNVYENFIVRNDDRNSYIANTANEFANKGKPTLILVKWIEHGKEIQKFLPNSVMITGEDSLSKRKNAIDKMRSKEQLITIATSLADEGIDILPLECGILAGSGKSSVKALQRVGRFLRPYPGKEGATIVDFYDNAKYLEDHSKRRKKIYKTEEEFEIHDI